MIKIWQFEFLKIFPSKSGEFENFTKFRRKNKKHWKQLHKPNCPPVCTHEEWMDRWMKTWMKTWDRNLNFFIGSVVNHSG
jgi:hypothetical protein